MAGIGPSMYPGSYPSSEQNPYPSISMENSASAFYGSLVSRDQHLFRMGCLDALSGHQASELVFIAPPVSMVVSLGWKL